MPVSLRSHLLTGTAAVITAGAVTVSAGTMAASSLPVVRVPTPVDVALAAWLGPTGPFDPLGDVMDTLQYANLYLFSIEAPPDPPPPAPQLPAGFDLYGIFPVFLAGGFPIATQYALNASDYVNQVGNYLLADQPPVGNDPLPGALRALNWAALALPQNIGVFANQLLTGNFVNALATVQFAVINPIQYAAYQVLNLGLYELGGVATRAAAVVTAVADWLPGAIRSLADDVTVFTNAVGYTVTSTVQAAQQFGPIAGLNQLVHQLLGSNGNNSFNRAYPTIPDALINQTIGEGGFITKSLPTTIPPDFVEAPSIRTKVAELRDALTEALAADVPAPEPPPFTVQGWYGSGVQSSIPTPWKPTPYFVPRSTPVAASRSVQSAPSLQTARSKTTKTAPRADHRSREQ